ncbi:MFS transporter [Longispora fulva]|uniref:MFS family permease n=1 Tax=Longispora fulva TaxID=619741 RepID=A0A8J7GYQ2_9ACTN|nr:MFS transporter [Longispora fulva]MBG6141440.1 MFS family permease [Longispora fulva]GIG59410.1 MFS transporter [Longispora fulva]
MYLATRSPTTAARTRVRVSGTVLGLGLVSFCTDASSELVTAFLPVYLLYGLGLSYVSFGLLDGLYTGATAALRLLGGHLADRLGRPRAVALVGYGLSAVTKLGFPLVGGSVPGIGALLAADRAGKGIRTAPRDAMITAASPGLALGRAFGVHRALDTAGALVGPLLAFGLLAGVGRAYDAVFVTSFSLAAVGVLILAFFVRDPTGGAEVGRPAVAAGRAADPVGGLAVEAGPAPGSGGAEGRRVAEGADAARPRLRSLFRHRGLRRVTGCVVLLGLGVSGDAFLFVALTQRTGVGGTALSLLPVGTAVAFLLGAVPVGRLADRLGAWRVFLAGQFLLVGAYALVGFGSRGWFLLPVVLGLHGLYYAATDGVLMAHVGALLPAGSRAGGLAVVQTGQALARMVAAVAFGALAQAVTPHRAFGCFAVILLLSTLLAARLPGGTAATVAVDSATFQEGNP